MELIDNQMIVYSTRDEGVILDSFKAVKNSSSYKMTISERKLQNPKIPLKFQNSIKFLIQTSLNQPPNPP